MTTAGAAVRRLTGRFTDAGIDTPGLDARLLVAHVLGIRPQDILMNPDAPLTAAQDGTLETLAARREAREPIGRILGRRGFWSLDLRLGPDTLEPRPDTETVVEAVLDAVPDLAAPLRILDLGTGTGCILLALLAEYPTARGLGIDIAPGAVDIATANAADAGMDGRATFRLGNWGEGLDGTFDVIVSNPPYIPAAEIAALDPEVRSHDPVRALDGGTDGLDAYRLLAPLVARHLAPGGVAVFEVGAGQAPAVAAMLSDSGLDAVWNRTDLGGVERCVCARRAKSPQD